jgi:phenylalanyl-tRNA synthetase beta chain
MKFTLSWLKDHLDTKASVEEISEKLTTLGLEVEGVEDQGAALRPFIVGEVKQAEQHPNADRLRVCTVDTGNGTLQIVCGAPNARADIKVAVSRPGDMIPSTGQVLKAGSIRGVESQGMLCSAKELGLSDESDGILELPEDTHAGQSLVEALNLGDPVIEIAVTPNRADCASVYGVARDLAAAGMGTLKPIEVERMHGQFTSPVNVTIADDARTACPLFAGRTIRGLANKPSPPWLQDRLRAIGLRPISALVDVTNYMTHDLGRPLHVFDTGRMQGNLHIRFARSGESLPALNGKTYEMKPNYLVLADDAGVASLGGIMGGEATGCTTDTTDVFLEVALFDPAIVAVAGRELQINSDARYRFERGVDPEFVMDAVEIATKMIVDLCGGEASQVVSVGTVPGTRRELTLREERVRTLGGMDVPADRQLKLLESIGCRFEGTTIIPPSWRGDLTREEDLVEEIMRLEGYDRIPALFLPPLGGKREPAINPAQRRIRQARRLLAARGLHEAITFAFMSSETATRFGGIEDSLKLVNPISVDLDGMRASILPNLVEAAARNAARGLRDVALFEVGAIYARDGQSNVAGLLRCGDAVSRGWRQAGRAAGVFDIKEDVQALLAEIGAPDSLAVEAGGPEWYHPGRSGAFKLGHKVIARFGELHPSVAEAMNCPSPCAIAEIFFDALPEPRRKGTERPALNLSPFQAVSRDFAFVVAGDVPAEAIVKAAKAADKTLIETVDIFDVYTGDGVEQGHKSVAVGVSLQPVDHSLTDAEIEAVSQAIVKSVTEATGAKLRG